MYLEMSAMTLFEEFHRTLEADRRREIRDALRRGELLEARAAADSHGVASVPLGDRAGRGSDPGADLGRANHLNPAARP